MTIHPNFILISGGQTGVDTAVLASAHTHRIPYKGFVPHGFTNEAGRIKETYISSPLGKLTETASTSPAERTRLNCEEADGVLTIAFCGEEEIGNVSRGTEVGTDVSRDARKDMLWVDLRGWRGVGNGDNEGDEEERRRVKEAEVDRIVEWLDRTGVERCAIGGPRESEQPGVQRESEELLGLVWERVKEAGWRSSRLGGGKRSVPVDPFLRDNRWTS